MPRDPASWEKMAAMPDDCERTATVALPTAARISAALDAFSTVYEMPLTLFKKGQTNKQTYGHERSLSPRTYTLCAMARQTTKQVTEVNNLYDHAIMQPLFAQVVDLRNWKCILFSHRFVHVHYRNAMVCQHH